MVFVTPTLSPPEKITGEEIRSLSEVIFWKFLVALAFDVSCIALAIYVSEIYWFNLGIYLVAILIIGSRQHAFGILIHECTHNRAFKSRKLNNIIGEPLAWSVLFYLEAYRDNHLTHHKNLNTQNDPDWIRKQKDPDFVSPLTKLQFLKVLLVKVSGIGFIKLFIQAKEGLGKYEVNKTTKRLRMITYILILSASIYFDFWKGLILYWLIPLVTFFTLFMYLRSVMEHHGKMEYDHNYTHSRNTDANFIEKFIFAPHNGGYHLDHHLYPSVPFYNLPKLRTILMKKEIYSKKAHNVKGYTRGILTELT